MTTGAMLRAARERLGLPRERLAERAGLSARELEELERLPSLPRRIADELETALRRLEKDAALDAAGVPACPVLAGWQAAGKAPGAAAVLSHLAACPACREREAHPAGKLRARRVRPRGIAELMGEVPPSFQSASDAAGEVTVRGGGVLALLLFLAVMGTPLGLWSAFWIFGAAVMGGAVAGWVHWAAGPLRARGGAAWYLAWMMAGLAGGAATLGLVAAGERWPGTGGLELVGMGGREWALGVVAGSAVLALLVGHAAAGRAAVAAWGGARRSRLSPGGVATAVSLAVLLAGVGLSTWQAAGASGMAAAGFGPGAGESARFEPAPDGYEPGGDELELPPVDFGDSMFVFEEEPPMDPAEEALRERTMADPGDVEAARELALYLLAERRLDEAKFEAARVAGMAPSDPGSYLLRARVHHGAGEFQESLRPLRALVAREPDHAGGWTMLADFAYQAGEIPEARLALKQARALDPGVFETHPHLRALADKE